ncbi:MAG: transcriptional repressor [Gammaproteobacteria bacterium]|nr:transcriptional repressor [Gammaproteobacteria bacterium]|tara:strand:- start:1124 stop:1600 length:477 start_codon:yes stop_codon:yes gene_type:complete
MTPDQQQQCLSNAEAHCLNQGARLTNKRKRILFLLLDSGTPLSAYQISDAYREKYEHQLSIMSVYRMLNFLISQHLAHRLETTNQYIACAHMQNTEHQGSEHGTLQFLICDQCKRVDESGIRNDILLQLNQELRKSGFTMQQEQLEIHGTCHRCAKKT